jgi:hypothetical protein
MRGVPRLFRSHPGYAAASTGVLAVAVGANLLVFTIVNALWIRPLPFPEPNRVVTIPRVRAVSIDQPAFRIFEGGIAGQVDTTDTAEGLTPRIAFAAAGPLETLGVTPGYFTSCDCRFAAETSSQPTTVMESSRSASSAIASGPTRSIAGLTSSARSCRRHRFPFV